VVDEAREGRADRSGIADGSPVWQWTNSRQDRFASQIGEKLATATGDFNDKLGEVAEKFGETVGESLAASIGDARREAESLGTGLSPREEQALLDIAPLKDVLDRINTTVDRIARSPALQEG